VSSKISILATKLKNNPKDCFLMFALALELLKLGEQQKALTLFQTIAKTDPNYVGVYYHLGKLLEELNSAEEAIVQYKTGIKIAQQLNDQHAKSELQGALMNLEMEINE
jgi:tetratricopeptide (TPR) repeat protein